MSPRNKWVEAIINELAPDAVRTALEEFLGNKTKEEAYSFFIQHRDDDWYELLPEKAKRAIRRLVPTDISWFDSKWAVEALAEKNPRVASLILGSPDLQGILADKIERLKRRIYEAKL